MSSRRQKSLISEEVSKTNQKHSEDSSSSQNPWQNIQTNRQSSIFTSDRLAIKKVNDSLLLKKVAKSFNVSVDDASKLYNQTSSQFFPENGFETFMKAMNIHNNNNKRTIEEKSLGTFDASQIPADFYLTPIDLHETRDELILIWSNSIIQYKNRNVLDTILEIDNGEQQRLFSIKYIPNNLFCTVGCQNGKGILLDLEKKKAIRFFGCITEDQSERRINCMDIKNSTIASGYNNGTLCFSDIREKPNTFQINENYHSDSQVCSLKWNMSNSILLASGASDSVVIISDQRKADEKIFSTRNKSIYTEKRVELINHRSSVKGLAWSPKGSSIIATGGGINDNMLHLWDIERNTNSPIISIDTKAQISSIFWPITMPNTIFTFHGASESFKGFIRIWNISHDFDSIETRSDIQAHGSRITSAVASLKTNQCVTLSSDRTLKFWQFLPSNLQTAASNDLQYSKLETLK